MNQQQRNYVLRRVAEIEKSKIEEARQRLSTPATNLSNEEKVEAIKNGEFTVVENGLTWYNRIRFTGQVPASTDEKAFAAACNRIVGEANAVRDEVMIGDCDQALDLLKNFEKVLDNLD